MVAPRARCRPASSARQLQRQHPLGDLGQQPTQLVEPARPVVQVEEDRRLPLAAHHRDRQRDRAAVGMRSMRASLPPASIEIVRTYATRPAMLDFLPSGTKPAARRPRTRQAGALRRRRVRRPETPWPHEEEQTMTAPAHRPHRRPRQDRRPRPRPPGCARGRRAAPPRAPPSPAFDWTATAPTWAARARTARPAAYVAYQPDLAVPRAADDIAAFAGVAAGGGRRATSSCSRAAARTGRDSRARRGSAARPDRPHHPAQRRGSPQNFSEGAFLDGILAGEPGAARPARSASPSSASTTSPTPPSRRLTDPAHLQPHLRAHRTPPR